MYELLVDKLEHSIRRDPGARGLISSEDRLGRLCPGHLMGAAAHLAEFGTRITLVTGFFVPHGEPPSAETDGPPGTVLLANSLRSLGLEVSVVTDAVCAGAVRAAAEADGFPPECVFVYPCPEFPSPREFFSGPAGSGLSHLVAVERVGPSHTLESVQLQSPEAAHAVREFESQVPPENRNRCHNMRGMVIDEYTAPMHELFEQLHHHRPDAKTIGIGDGANEIGMGSIPWHNLRHRLQGDHSGRIPCRIATDWTIVAGTSNWGAYALAAATLLACDRIDALRHRGRDQQLHVLEQMVEKGPAVDGITGRREPTVDGLPFLTYIQPWEHMRRLIGLMQ